jgi:hypothetical protein
VGAIDASLDRGFKVILSYWEASNAKDGRVDDPEAFDTMWDTVVEAYDKDPHVYFEPMNEPFGYSLDEWVALTSSWLSRRADVPRDRVVISGTGYDDNVTGVGAAPGLNGTLLSLHFYRFWASDTTEAAWKANLEPRIGKYGWRTIIDEAGAPMTIGLNYGNHEGNVSTDYFGALTETAHDQSMGIVCWPGLRTGDAYSMTTTDGTALDLWDCNGGRNQSWNWTADKQLTVYGDKCMAIGGDGSSAGSPVIITGCTGASNQAWELNADLSITSIGHPELCLDAVGAGTSNGTPIDVWYCNGQTNQQWTRS